MKKLVGGVFLLCLTAMTLTLSEDGETYTNITQPEILEQLTNLKNYVSNPKMIKPVWVQLKNGDEIVVVQGELKVVDTGEFEICVQLNGYKLVISIEFTQATLEDDTPIDDWYIAENDAKYLFITDAQSIGAISELPVFENIVDKDGHKRFIEGEITNIEELPEGLTFEYGKWSLSGTHLLLVLSGKLLNASSISAGVYAKTTDLPEWLYDKLIPTFQNTFEQKSISYYGNDYSSQNVAVLLQREGTTKQIQFYFSSITATQDRGFRIQFDLLIDNE